MPLEFELRKWCPRGTFDSPRDICFHVWTQVWTKGRSGTIQDSPDAISRGEMIALLPYLLS